MIPRRRENCTTYNMSMYVIIYAKMPTTDDVDTWSIDPSKKNTGVSLRLFEELGGYVSLEV